MFFERDLVRQRWAFNVGVETEDRRRKESMRDLNVFLSVDMVM